MKMVCTLQALLKGIAFTARENYPKFWDRIYFSIVFYAFPIRTEQDCSRPAAVTVVMESAETKEQEKD